MKKMKLLAVVAAVVAAASQSASALTFTDAGTTAPVGSYISNPQVSPGSGATYTYFDSNNTGGVGQSFTATTSTWISTVTIKGAAYFTSPTNPVFPQADFTLKLGTLTGSTYGALGSETVTVPAGTIHTNPGLNYTHYFTFTLAAPVPVTAGNTYVFDFLTTTANNATDYFVFNGSPAGVSPYAGGNSLALNSNTSPTFVASTGSNDVTFFLGSAPVPEPSQWALVPVLGTIAFLAFRRFRSQSVA